MAEQRNIVIVGGSNSGLGAAHYALKHIVPALKAKHDAKHHVYLLNPSSDWYYRIAAPRIAASTTLMSAEKALFNIPSIFKQYGDEDFTFIEAEATGLDTTARTISYSKGENTEKLSYHALIVATGSKSHDSVFSHTNTPALLEAIKTRNSKLLEAKDIIVVGGGPTSVEHAAEIGELLNGKPGWFGSPPKKVNITLITGANQLLVALRPAIAKTAEDKLKQLGVDVMYNTRVGDVSNGANGKTTVALANGEKMVVDLYIPAHGVLPNSSWLPKSLLNDQGYLKTNDQTLRVDDAGSRVYAIGDIGSYSRNTAIDINDSLPVAMVNLKRDLLAYSAENPDKKPNGNDRIYKPSTSETMFVPVGSNGGVGALFGWRAPNWLVWLFKSRDMMLSMGTVGMVTGDKFKKESLLTRLEIVE
jgi:NADH dehydrogenase FAD-containing subunit